MRSRLARKESKRMMRQSVLLIIVTIGILWAVVRYGVPALVQFAGFLGEVRSSSQPIEQNDTIAPFVPQLSVTYEATPSAQIDLSGFAESGATIMLFNNGNKVDEKTVDGQGNFVFDGVRLRDGSNKFTARALDGAGNESGLSQEYEIVYDEVPPELSIDSPTQGEEFFGSQERVIEVSGTSEPEARVYVNERFAFVGSDGNYRASINLEEGENVLVVRAVDAAGNESIEQVTVNFRN